jgi:hypothetical protein
LYEYYPLKVPPVLTVSNSVVETGIAIVCSCMPAFSTFAKHMLKHSSFLVSIRSVLSRYGPVSSNKATCNSSKYSHSPAQAFESKRSRLVMPDFRSTAQDDSYVELQDPNGHAWTAGQYSAHVVHPTGPNDLGSWGAAGIAKTVAVEVV